MARIRKGVWRTFPAICFGLLWAAVVSVGLVWLTRYQMTPGKAAAAVSTWPGGATLPLANDRPTILMFIHPQCPCSRASIGELSRIMTRCADQVAADVIVFTPPGQPLAWSHTDLWRSAEAIPGVRIHSDGGGLLTRQFGAATSGQVFLYDTHGHLLFSGGITGSRSHFGDNVGEDAVVALIEGKGPATTQPAITAVYGCPNRRTTRRFAVARQGRQTMTVNIENKLPTSTDDGRRLFEEHYQQIARRCDHIFAILFMLQWVAGMIVAWVISPYAWTGLSRHVHPHVWAAALLGGAILSFPTYLILTRPGTVLTRHVVAVAQMLWSALLIHLSGGRIETHFHVFGSLAFIAFYRDWRVLITATVVVAADHFLRGIFWPESVFGIATASHWRWVEHAGWVIFEDIFLVMACVQSRWEMMEIAERHAQAQRHTAELSASQHDLKIAKEAAEAANRAKSDFLAKMSHEIRTPLNGVIGMIDLLGVTEMTESQHRYNHLARDAANSLMVVIQDILDFSKIEAGKVEIEAIEFDLQKLVEDLTDLLAPVAARKNLVLASFLRPDLPRRLIGDPNRIRQVLTNLVNNALKFTAAGHVSIRCTLQRQEDMDVVIHIDVEDTGIGIPADRLDRLFKSFSQVDASTTRRFGGTGLGLAISKRLVELMGGEIGIQSKEGKGTTFWFTVKLRAVTATNDSATKSAEALRSMRLLAIEPDPTHRRILAEQLEGHLSSTSAVVNPDSALRTLRQAAADGNPFTVAVIPHGIPELGSLRTAIQSDAKLRQIKLIAMIDIDDRTNTTAIRQAGFVSYIQRPLTQSRLMDTLSSAVIELPGKEMQPSILQQSQAAVQDALRGLHLLVAEDNEMNQFITQEMLRRVGCTCDIVGDGTGAVDGVKSRHYDAVLMDCQMPGMDGLEATRLIRQNESAIPGSRRIPIIALTAEAIDGDREKCLAAGMDGYVSKPIDTNHLFATLRSLVPADIRRLAGGGDAPPPPPAEAEPPINAETLFGRCMRDGDFASHTLEKFRLRVMEDIELLRRGVAAGNAEETTRLAHNFKAVAAHVAAAPLRRIAFEIEQAGERRDLQFAEKQLARLDEEAKRCTEFIPQAISNIARLPKSDAPQTKSR